MAEATFIEEKHCQQKYNVSCIMTMPQYQRQGYGRFLIDFSYLLSRREGQPGTPERPLSDLGAVSYRAYWKSKVLLLLDQYRSEETKLTVKEIADLTGMNNHDISDTLHELQMFKIKNEKVVLAINWVTVDAFLEKFKSKVVVELNDDSLKWTPPVFDMHSPVTPRSPGGGLLSPLLAGVSENAWDDVKLPSPTEEKTPVESGDTVEQEAHTGSDVEGGTKKKKKKQKSPARRKLDLSVGFTDEVSWPDKPSTSADANADQIGLPTLPADKKSKKSEKKLKKKSENVAADKSAEKEKLPGKKRKKQRKVDEEGLVELGRPSENLKIMKTTEAKIEEPSSCSSSAAGSRKKKPKKLEKEDSGQKVFEDVVSKALKLVSPITPKGLLKPVKRDRKSLLQTVGEFSAVKTSADKDDRQKLKKQTKKKAQESGEHEENKEDVTKLSADSPIEAPERRGSGRKSLREGPATSTKELEPSSAPRPNLLELRTPAEALLSADNGERLKRKYVKSGKYSKPATLPKLSKSAVSKRKQQAQAAEDHSPASIAESTGTSGEGIQKTPSASSGTGRTRKLLIRGLGSSERGHPAGLTIKIPSEDATYVYRSDALGTNLTVKRSPSQEKPPTGDGTEGASTNIFSILQCVSPVTAASAVEQRSPGPISVFSPRPGTGTRSEESETPDPTPTKLESLHAQAHGISPRHPVPLTPTEGQKKMAIPTPTSPSAAEKTHPSQLSFEDALGLADRHKVIADTTRFLSSSSASRPPHLSTSSDIDDTSSGGYSSPTKPVKSVLHSRVDTTPLKTFSGAYRKRKRHFDVGEMGDENPPNQHLVEIRRSSGGSVSEKHSSAIESTEHLKMKSHQKSHKASKSPRSSETKKPIGVLRAWKGKLVFASSDWAASPERKPSHLKQLEKKASAVDNSDLEDVGRHRQKKLKAKKRKKHRHLKHGESSISHDRKGSKLVSPGTGVLCTVEGKLTLKPRSALGGSGSEKAKSHKSNVNPESSRTEEPPVKTIIPSVARIFSETDSEVSSSEEETGSPVRKSFKPSHAPPRTQKLTSDSKQTHKVRPRSHSPRNNNGKGHIKAHRSHKSHVLSTLTSSAVTAKDRDKEAPRSKNSKSQPSEMSSAVSPRRNRSSERLAQGCHLLNGGVSDISSNVKPAVHAGL